MNLSLQVRQHLKAWGVAFVAAIFIWTVQYWHTYIGPAAIATAGEGRFLIGTAVSLVMTAAVLTVIFLPATIVAAVARRLLDLPRWTEIFFALAFGLVFSAFLTVWYARALTTHSAPTLIESVEGFGIYLAGPLCVYWLLTRYRKQQGEQAAPSDGDKPGRLSGQLTWGGGVLRRRRAALGLAL